MQTRQKKLRFTLLPKEVILVYFDEELAFLNKSITWEKKFLL